MRRAATICLALTAAIGAGGSLAGLGLANFVQSGAFEFYRRPAMAQWTPEPPAAATALQSTDLAFASDRRAAPGEGAAEEALASFDR